MNKNPQSGCRKSRTTTHPTRWNVEIEWWIDITCCSWHNIISGWHRPMLDRAFMWQVLTENSPIKDTKGNHSEGKLVSIRLILMKIRGQLLSRLSLSLSLSLSQIIGESSSSSGNVSTTYSRIKINHYSSGNSISFRSLVVRRLFNWKIETLFSWILLHDFYTCVRHWRSWDYFHLPFHLQCYSPFVLSLSRFVMFIPSFYFIYFHL